MAEFYVDNETGALVGFTAAFATLSDWDRPTTAAMLDEFRGVDAAGYGVKLKGNFDEGAVKASLLPGYRVYVAPDGAMVDLPPVDGDGAPPTDYDPRLAVPDIDPATLNGAVAFLVRF